jgi:hypothetical protein
MNYVKRWPKPFLADLLRVRIGAGAVKTVAIVM